MLWASGGGFVPVDLGAAGAPGCFLYTGMQVQVGLTTSAGVAERASRLMDANPEHAASIELGDEEVVGAAEVSRSVHARGGRKIRRVRAPGDVDVPARIAYGQGGYETQPSASMSSPMQRYTLSERSRIVR